MKTSACILLLFLFLFIPRVAAAHPPSNMELTYDVEKGTLAIQARHVTRNPRDHRIRKVVITKNSEEPLEFFFSTQTTPTMFIEEIPLKAAAGDTIQVKAICSAAGSAEASLTVPEEEPAGEESSRTP
jgi:hypothetical protein